MPTRRPRAGFSVARRLSERARVHDPAANPDPQVAAPGGFAGMVDALRGLVEQLSETARAHSETSDGKTSMVFGYTLRMGSQGVSAEPFGNVPDRAKAAKDKPAQTAAPAARQPIVEVFEDGDSVVVVAELPGADPDSIACRIDGRTLLIEASGAQSYRKELTLPAAVQPVRFLQSFRNGILEVRLTRDSGG